MIDDKETAREEARQLIIAADMSVAELSAATGVNRATLFRITSEESQHAPSGRTLAALRRVVGAVPDSTYRSPVQLTQLPNGRARLQMDATIPFSVALQILAMVQGDEK